MPVRLVLWDIDHTLLELHRLHYDLYAEALPAAFGIRARRLPDLTGRTDRDNSTEYLRTHGIEPSEANLAAFWKALADRLEAYGDLARAGQPTTGAQITLALLAGVPDLYQSVLTGNIRPLAERKLSAFGFDKYLDFEIGGYGEDSVNRAALVGMALQRLADTHGVVTDPAHTVLIGDTPLDIAAAHASGARVIGVATGKSDFHSLVRLGADSVLPDLADSARVLTTIETLAREADR